MATDNSVLLRFKVYAVLSAHIVPIWTMCSKPVLFLFSATRCNSWTFRIVFV